VSNTVVVLAAPASLKAQSLKELMQMVKEQPGKLNYASVTQVYDIMMAAFLKDAGLEMARVTYKDAVSAQNDLVQERIHLYSAAYAIVRGHAQGGRIRLLAVQNRTRAPGLDLPTAAEAGFPQLTLDGLVGIMAARSSGLADAARDRIAADVKAHLSDPQLNERMTATGQIVNPGSPAEFAAAIQEQSANLAAWSKTIGGKLK
jgi:tripartite-type tricarboxylate transporter receptor subunit TctC